MYLFFLKFIGAGIAIAGCVLGAGIGIGMLSLKVSESIARQPEMKKDLRALLFMDAGLIDGVAIIGIAFALLMMFMKK